MIIIATWCMAYSGVVEGLKEKNIENAIIKTITNVENNPLYNSVGYGGLPNKYGTVELDAAYLNGTNFDFGAVMAVSNLKNPIKLAFHLSKLKRNNQLAGVGALEYAKSNNFELHNNDYFLSQKRYQEYNNQKIEAYDDHDTVCVIATDLKEIHVGTSTSGLFMKEKGRVGDSPILGGGLYADSKIGAASCTGVGEDIIKNVLSYEVVRLMKDGNSAMDSCKIALKNQLQNLNYEVGSISIIAIDNKGKYGVASNKEEFSFVYGSDVIVPKVYLLKNNDSIIEADEKWLENFENNLKEGRS